jgi:preprotein translocase subunit SecB
MEQKNNLESGFKVNNILLMENTFKREGSVVFDKNQTKNFVNIDVNVQVIDKAIIVNETLTYSEKFNDIEQVSIMIRMIGVFEQIGTTSLNPQEFGEVNGAAIIFPYMREHLTSLSGKSGLGLIVLPPFNFTRKEPVISKV